MNRLVIAGSSSGVGKTTISLGIMAALSRRNKKVAPFKVGPDYIDPAFHKFVTNNPSYNLDSWLFKEDIIKHLFYKNTINKDIAIIEGVMGLYDGFGIEKDEGSTAHVSKMIKAPVVLVIDGRGMSASAAAGVLGYKVFDEELDIKGVIINKLSGEAHYKLLKSAIEKHTNIPCLGFLPSNMNISLKSRHLGLVPAEEVDELREKVNELADLIEQYIDIDKIIELSSSACKLEKNNNPYKEFTNMFKGLRIGYALDKAFNFYYEDNLNLIKELGVELVPFSPIKDEVIPEAIDGLYIGGGFPEVFAKELQDNKSIRESIKESLEQGLPAYAECGGLMYLTESIRDLDNNLYNMVGFYPTSSKMTNRLQRFGYVEISTEDNINTKAHEFHRSTVEYNVKIKYQYKVYKKREGQITKSWECGLVNKNALAAYAHIHFYSNIEFLINFLNKCKGYK